MKKKRKNYGKLGKALGTLLIIIAVFSSSLTAGAYQRRNIDVLFEEEYSGNEIESFFLDGDGMYIIEEDMWIWECEKYFTTDYTIVFVAEDGSVYCDTDLEENYENYGICIHTYMNGKYVKHEKKSDDSCSIECYTGKRCSKCDYIVYEQHLSTHLYDVCPH